MYCCRSSALLKPWGASRLQDFLGNFPHTPREPVSQQQKKNIRAYEIKIRKLVQQGRLSPHDIVAIHPDRQDGLTYPQHITINNYPTMTTHNGDTMLLSVDDVVAATPDSQHRVFRVLQATERLTIAGFPVKLVEHLGVKLTMQASQWQRISTGTHSCHSRTATPCIVDDGPHTVASCRLAHKRPRWLA